MAKRPKVAPVNYRVPFYAAEPDASRFGTPNDEWRMQKSPVTTESDFANFYRQAQEARKTPYTNVMRAAETLGAVPGMMRGWLNRQATNPIGNAKSNIGMAYTMAEPFTSIGEAGKAVGEFVDNPSRASFGNIISRGAMAAADVIPYLEVAKAGKLAKVARLGRY